jgi:hypothetical protein
MKLSIVSVLSVAVMSGFGQVPGPDAFSTATLDNTASALLSPGMSLVDQGPHHRTWQGLTTITNGNGNGAVSTRKTGYVELTTGMAHFADGQWRPSSSQFVITPNGAEATNAQHQVALAGNINAEPGSVCVRTPEGKQLVSKVLGLSYFDTATGASLWVGETKDAYGELLPSGHEALYPDAFSGCQADVLYLNEISRFDQLIILRQQLPSCADWGMSPASTWLCVITEFLDPPQPEVQPLMIDGAADQRLDFGVMQMIHGEAFAIGSETNRVPVIKRWLLLEGRHCLVEQVPLSAIQPMLADLPPATASIGSPADPFLHKLLAGTKAKPRSLHEPLYSLALPPRHSVAAAKTPERSHTGGAFKLASARPAYKGLALDYTLVTSQSTPFVFQGDTVYYVTGPVNLSSTSNVIEGLTVIKFTNSPNATITVNGLIWKTKPFAPAIFTACDDNTLGAAELISGSTGNPTTKFYGGIALDLSGISNPTVSNVRFCYLSNAVKGTSLTLRNVQFNQCANALAAGSLHSRFYNALLYRVGTVINTNTGALGQDNPVFENVTAHYCTNFMGDTTGSISLTNCLFAAVTNWHCATTTSNSSVVLDSDAGVFQSVGGAGHFLAENSPYRGIGTAVIDPDLLNDLRKKTTCPPIVYSNVTIAADTTFVPQAQRDTTAKDVGWHYDPLDYVFGGCTANADVTFKEGTAVGWFRSGGFGLHLANLKNASFNGSAASPCWWVRYTTVQELATSTWSGGSGWAGLTGSGGTISLAPTVNANFLHCSVTAGEGGYGNHFRDDWGYLVVRAWSSEFGGGSLGGYTSAEYLTNCLFERTSVWLDGGQVDIVWRLRNCTFHGGQLYMSRSANPTPVSVRDCTFDASGWPVTDQYANNATYTDYDYNAFLYGQPRTVANGLHDVIVTNSFRWQTSWFGDYYLPTNSPLVKAGDVTADAVGLYHFTAWTNQVIEGTNTVTIGCHYVAADSAGVPLDGDGDALENYVEDLNGNGVYDPALGETDWKTYTYRNGLTPSSILQVFTPLR